MVMYQNEAYSYTPYPGCAWTAEGTIRFNRDYLAPTLREKHPEVKLYLGTFNTNRQDYVEKIVKSLTPNPSPKERGVDTDATKDTLIIQGLGFQWEGRENLDFMREHHPDLHMVSSESECGNGQMDWRAGEHTFYLLHEYIGRGCDEYYNWNFILCDQGRSAWGWKQNALVQVITSPTGGGREGATYRYTPEYYAYKHFSHFVEPGSTLLAFYPIKEGLQAIVFQRPDGKRVVICGNTNNETRELSIPVGKRYLNVTLAAHSFNTFVEK
jgi:glucosylceramidase